MLKYRTVALTLALAGVACSARAWDYQGHRMVAAVAVASLPEDFPAFARTAESDSSVQYNSGEPDRWRILKSPALQHLNEPDHYLDLEDLEKYGLTPETLPELRNELIGRIYVERERNPDKFPAAEPGKDEAKVHILFGLLPYAINENFQKLRAEFMSLRYQESIDGGTGDVSQARQNIVHTMGIMSHFVGDAAQPLHVTMHHHGWAGDNPNHYTHSYKFHELVDGKFIAAAGINFEGLKSRVAPTHTLWPDDSMPDPVDAFPAIMSFLVETHARVEPLYQLQKDKKLEQREPSPEGRAFIEDQLLRGGQFLGQLYYSAYRAAQRAPFQLPP